MKHGDVTLDFAAAENRNPASLRGFAFDIQTLASVSGWGQRLKAQTGNRRIQGDCFSPRLAQTAH